MLQALAIHVEDIIIGTYSRLLPSDNPNAKRKEDKDGSDMKAPLWKILVGYTWVTCWFWFSLGWGGDANLKSGLATISPIKLSIVRPLVDWYEQHA